MFLWLPHTLVALPFLPLVQMAWLVVHSQQHSLMLLMYNPLRYLL